MCAGSKVAITNRPPSPRTRRVSANARGRSSTWTTSIAAARPSEPTGRCDGLSRFGDQIVRFRHRLDRVLRLLERRLGHEHRQRVVERARELGLDPRGAQDLLELLGLADVARDGDLDHPPHRRWILRLLPSCGPDPPPYEPRPGPRR